MRQDERRDFLKARMTRIARAEISASTARSWPSTETCTGLPEETVLYGPIWVSSIPAMRCRRSRIGRVSSFWERERAARGTSCTKMLTRCLPNVEPAVIPRASHGIYN